MLDSCVYFFNMKPAVTIIKISYCKLLIRRNEIHTKFFISIPKFAKLFLSPSKYFYISEIHTILNYNVFLYTFILKRCWHRILVEISISVPDRRVTFAYSTMGTGYLAWGKAVRAWR
jgi:hypothetical protein